MSINIISVFNNKGGVGKTTLTFHLAHALAEMGRRVLLVDLDPQCNLSIYCLPTEQIQQIWDAEVPYIDAPGFADSRKNATEKEFSELCAEPRTVHFLLKPAEEGTGDIEVLPPAVNLAANLDLLPGRLTLHMFEEAVARRWSDAFVGQPLAIRTISEIRRLISEYARQNDYDIAIVDTSPSLGVLNKVVLSTVDGFVVPCAPDLFSLYGVRNIGSSLTRWAAELRTLYTLIAPSRRPYMPARLVRFLGYTVYNAKLRAGSSPWNMAIAHYNYAQQIPDVIAAHMPEELSEGISAPLLREPIGEQSVMHTHNTFPAHAQKYHCPMWILPSHLAIEDADMATIRPNRDRYIETSEAYRAFANSLLERVRLVGDPS
ncbi:ParA family protein [Burkholderia ubonensis]|uniref:ParA family protein n=1 Tax=Burkholderia ubonensis TaxID=101571 RepID=UPI00016A31E7|nr:AAA family ATPase [Burkholderia ubonensis]